MRGSKGRKKNASGVVALLLYSAVHSAVAVQQHALELRSIEKTSNRLAFDEHPGNKAPCLEAGEPSDSFPSSLHHGGGGGERVLTLRSLNKPIALSQVKREVFSCPFPPHPFPDTIIIKASS